MDINDQIADNLGLVYQQLSRFKLRDDQDAESYAYEALYKAITTYDAANGTAFSTYATCVIANTLRMHIRKLNKKRQLEVLSYDANITDDEDSGTFIDKLMYAEDTESVVLFNELHGAVLSACCKVYSTLSANHKRIIFMWYDSNCTMTQREIASAIGISQAIVSRAISNFKYKLKLELEEYM